MADLFDIPGQFDLTSPHKHDKHRTVFSDRRIETSYSRTVDRLPTAPRTQGSFSDRASRRNYSGTVSFGLLLDASHTQGKFLRLDTEDANIPRQFLPKATHPSRFMGSYKWGYKSPNMGYKYIYPTYNPYYNYP